MAHVDDVEGEDQRNAVRKACEGLKISVMAIKEGEPDERAQLGQAHHADGQRRVRLPEHLDRDGHDGELTTQVRGHLTGEQQAVLRGLA